MPIRTIPSGVEGLPPLRVTEIPGRVKKGKRGKADENILPEVRFRVGASEKAVVIQKPLHLTGNPNVDTVCMDGVLATVAQWREALCPILGLAPPQGNSVI